MTTQTPAEALARVEKPLGEVLSWLGREPALYFRGFPHTFEVKEGILLTMYEAEQLKATLARAVENDARFRWMQANCYSNEHRDRDWPHVVIADVCIGTIPGDKTGHYNVGPEARVGVAALDFAIDEAMRASAAIDTARGVGRGSDA